MVSLIFVPGLTETYKVVSLMNFVQLLLREEDREEFEKIIEDLSALSFDLVELFKQTLTNKDDNKGNFRMRRRTLPCLAMDRADFQRETKVIQYRAKDF